jgi:hypothetical protein
VALKEEYDLSLRVGFETEFTLLSRARPGQVNLTLQRHEALWAMVGKELNKKQTKEGFKL